MSTRREELLSNLEESSLGVKRLSRVQYARIKRNLLKYGDDKKQIADALTHQKKVMGYMSRKGRLKRTTREKSRDVKHARAIYKGKMH